MKKALVALTLSLICQFAFAEIKDGIYSFPGTDGYLLHLSNGDTSTTYIFTQRGNWRSMRGSKVGDNYQIADLVEGELKAFEVAESPSGLAIERLYCTSYPDMDPTACDEFNTPAATPVYLATEGLKAIYRTQFGADIALFESNDTVVFMLFELGDSTSLQTILGGYTARKAEGLRITDINSVFETDPGGAVDITFDIQISDLENPQAEFVNYTCDSFDGSDISQFCAEIEETFFDKLVRVF